MPEDKHYLGDGAYVSRDSEYVVLTTSDGVRDTNIVYLEPAVLAELLTWLRRKGYIPEKRP